MSDRTTLAIGRNTFAMPKVTKRAIEAAIASALSALLVLAILMINNALTGKGGFARGYDLWLVFIKRSDILGTMVLTAAVTVAFVYWFRGQGK